MGRSWPGDYESFLKQKSQLGGFHGFEPVWVPDFLFDFQKSLVDWAVRKGRAAIFADCGMGKTPMSLVWAENIVRKTNGRVLIATPLAVSHQFVREGEKFGIECLRSWDGKPAGNITVTNYERLRLFNSGQLGTASHQQGWWSLTSWCDEVQVLMLDGWQDSVGVKAEMEIANLLGKPVYMIEV